MVARWILLRRVLRGESKSKSKKQSNNNGNTAFTNHSLQGGAKGGIIIKGGMKVVSPLYIFFEGGKGGGGIVSY